MKENPALRRLAVAIDQDDDATAESAVQTLTPEDEPVLLAWLTHANSDYCWWGARALAICGGSAAAPALAQLLTAGQPALRSVATFALGHLHRRAPLAVHPHLPMLAARLTDTDGAVRQTTADALALCGEDAIPMLAAVLADEHEGARTRAAYALRKMASLATAPLLFRYLNDPNYLVHTFAHEGLDELGLLDNLLLIP